MSIFNAEIKAIIDEYFAELLVASIIITLVIVIICIWCLRICALVNTEPRYGHYTFPNLENGLQNNDQNCENHGRNSEEVLYPALIQMSNAKQMKDASEVYSEDEIDFTEVKLQENVDEDEFEPTLSSTFEPDEVLITMEYQGSNKDFYKITLLETAFDTVSCDRSI